MPVSILLVFLIDKNWLIGEDHRAIVMQQLITPDEESQQIGNMLNGSHADNKMKPAIELIGEREHLTLMQMHIRKLAFAAPKHLRRGIDTMKRGKLTLAVNGFNGMAYSSADIKDV